MKLFYLTLISIILTAQISFGAPPLSNLRMSSPTQNDSLNCRFNLSQNMVSLGEPIVLHAKITNLGDQNAAIFLGENINHQGWLTVSLRDSVGRNIPVPPLPTPMPNPLSRGTLSLSPNDTHEEDVVLSNVVHPADPGCYYITFYVHLPTTDMPNADAFENSYTLPLTITPADPQKLRAVATSLQSAILTVPDGELKETDIKALFSMPETAVFSTWRSLATNHSLSSYLAPYVAWQLEQVGSPRACDLLVSMAQTNPSRWNGIKQSPFQDLITLRQTVSRDMQSYIDVLLQKLGGNFSKRLLVPGVVN